MTTTPEQPDQPEDEISLLDLLQVIVDNLRLLVLGPLAVGILALGISFLIPPTYTAKTQFLPPQQQQSAAASMLASLGGLGGLAGAVGGLKNPADQFIAFMKSNAVLDALIERYKLEERYKADYKMDARKTLTKRTNITSGKDGLIALEFDDKDPQFAASVANAYVEELRKVLGRMAVTEAQQRRLFFEKQLTQAKDKLTAAEQALKATGISDSVLKSNPVSAVAGIAALKAQVTVQEVKVGAMRGYLAETAPDFKQAMTELANLRAQLTKQDKDDTSTATAGQGDYISKYREFKYNETLFELFAKQYELAKVDEAREGAVIQVLDVAQAPERKAKPKKALMAIIATLATGFALLLFVFIRQALKRASSDSETERKLSALKASWRQALGK
ncbi:lipopolysaccharide biosynthesis protein [Limnohabitans sp. MMS-10A-160]|uniref:GumC family protein n=1 Tax=unclassified Limnohabitans TaxID=2626134 RepID=UPI000D3A6144|nr:MULTISPECIES: Wzz/FepE/Etk N-terminal domain-containing protein [unclassified Limnohabitans]PUE15617.1 lipopolysaccharide biosynthesis protein [Limnohabitans sp. MMS-10A-192]PUE23531.1 lipopolysaccharide biosynthesis protein [Limnohabitans sp. MMS-10A-160]